MLDQKGKTYRMVAAYQYDDEAGGNVRVEETGLDQ